MRRGVAIGIAATAAFAGPAWAGPAIKLCAPVRVDRFLHADPRGQFGAFKVTATGVSCAAGRSEASAYIHHPRAAEHTHATVAGWACTSSELDVAQRVQVSCRRGGAVVTFQDEIPSG